MTFLSSSRLTCVALAATLGALPAIAQDTASDQPATEAEASQPTDAADAPATAETEQPADQALGQPYVAEVAGDWQIECLRTTLEADPCRMVQILLDQGNPAVRVEVVTLPAESPAPAVATFYAPLETLLSEQLTLSIDGGRKSQHQFNYCSPQFCVAQVPFAPDAVTAFKRGAKAEAIIVPLRAPDQQVNLTMSLSGFTAGYDKLAEMNKASEAAVRKAQSEGGN
ncbi:invasion associated locus B family protein [Aliiruegeria sabulilitoris]|uniref:invasion associated locus B family protein n=1 Tax=Aliiruegeria sabulilitoris TaxID=1510458 RepID=UPI00082CCD57|nr:invasion associated locus B family protein [Aliiruegeria sabulilitoris]NDR58224.1 invasion associated locus B family protein [Pseudoruegeria sp. M32A2M]